MDNKICKIVYFDEDSVTDYVQIVAGGELENTEELLSAREVEESQSAKIAAKGGIGGVFKALLGWELGVSADVNAGLSFSSSKMVKNIVKNTILTDFLETLESQGALQQNKSKLPKGAIKKFKNYAISAEWFRNNAERYDNIRILKAKLENAIFDKLAEVFVIQAKD